MYFYQAIKIVSLATMIVCSGFANAQKIKTARGTYQVRLEDNMTREEAYRKVEDLAKVDAIINVFGQYVEQQAQLTVESGRSDFYIVGNTKVKGQWIKTTDKKIDEETRTEKGQNGTTQSLWITCRIEGRVKEATPKARIEYEVLNCPDTKCRTATFYSGEQLYLYFRSPIDGYLNIYLDDGQSVFRLLPYSGVKNANSVKIEADREYWFFAPQKAAANEPKPDELELFTMRTKEFNTLYLVFSEKEYFKPVLDSEVASNGGYLLPKSLSKREFEEWLAGNRADRDDFLDVERFIEIVRK